MRIIIMSLFLGFVYINCNAQDSTKAKPAYIEQYCEIVASTKMFSSKLSLEIMYGDEVNTFWKHHDYRLKDAEGNLQKFNNVIDCMNYMGKQGWVFVSTLLLSSGTNGSVYHYILKKSFPSSFLEDAK